MRIWRYATAPPRTSQNDLLSAFLSSSGRNSGATAARGAASRRRGCRRRPRSPPGPEVLGHGPKGRRAAGTAPVPVFLPGFDGYSSTFRDLPGGPRSGNALTCENASRGPRSTRASANSTRITEKPAGAGEHKPVYLAATGSCPAIRCLRPTMSGLRLGPCARRTLNDATIPTKRRAKVPEAWRGWLPFVGNVAWVTQDVRTSSARRNP